MADELAECHERELEELEERCDRHIEAARAAGKGKKAKALVEAAEREVEKWRYELHERHRAEAEEGSGGPAEVLEAEGEAPPGPGKAEAGADARAAERLEAEKAGVRKREKAQRKRDLRLAKDSERDLERERERLESGPSQRALELAELATQLARQSPPLQVFEVAADGHCLYRAVGDQLQRLRPELAAECRRPEELRAVCADALRKRPDDYSPFAELSGSEDFEGYCDRVERSGDWGGELELRALADTLHVRILVHRAGETKPLELGGAAGEPLQVTYHKHYYALGEHYNSVEPIALGK